MGARGKSIVGITHFLVVERSPLSRTGSTHLPGGSEIWGTLSRMPTGASLQVVFPRGREASRDALLRRRGGIQRCSTPTGGEVLGNSPTLSSTGQTIEVPNDSVDRSSWESLACSRLLSRGLFIPLLFGFPQSSDYVINRGLEATTSSRPHDKGHENRGEEERGDKGFHGIHGDHHLSGPETRPVAGRSWGGGQSCERASTLVVERFPPGALQQGGLRCRLA